MGEHSGNLLGSVCQPQESRYQNDMAAGQREGVLLFAIHEMELEQAAVSPPLCKRSRIRPSAAAPFPSLHEDAFAPKSATPFKTDFVGYGSWHPAGDEFRRLEKAHEEKCSSAEGEKRAGKNETEDLQELHLWDNDVRLAGSAKHTCLRPEIFTSKQ